MLQKVKFDASTSKNGPQRGLVANSQLVLLTVSFRSFSEWEPSYAIQKRIIGMVMQAEYWWREAEMSQRKASERQIIETGWRESKLPIEN